MEHNGDMGHHSRGITEHDIASHISPIFADLTKVACQWFSLDNVSLSEYCTSFIAPSNAERGGNSEPNIAHLLSLPADDHKNSFTLLSRAECRETTIVP